MEYVHLVGWYKHAVLLLLLLLPVCTKAIAAGTEAYNRFVFVVGAPRKGRQWYPGYRWYHTGMAI